jgi:hypothetical protein
MVQLVRAALTNHANDRIAIGIGVIFDDDFDIGV